MVRHSTQLLRTRLSSFGCIAALLILSGFPQSLWAQTEATPYVAPLVMPAAMPGEVAKPVQNAVYIAPLKSTEGKSILQQAGCASCDGGLFPSNVRPRSTGPGIYGGNCPRCGSTDGACDLGCVNPGCGEGGCYAGREPCTTCVGTGPFSRMACAFRNAINCPDPCYEPRWIPGQNASLFVDSARPVSQTRIRWDAGRNLLGPDRAEYFWAATGGRGPANAETRLNYNTLNIFTEAGTERFSFFVNMQFRSTETTNNGNNGGFGDMSIGTKSVLVDSDLLLMSFQFSTFLPTGNAGLGTGVGHVSLEPALLSSIKLYTNTWLQSQFAYWIPLGGSVGRAGGVFQFHNSLNHTLFCPLPDLSLIGTFETQGYTFGGGSVTLPGGAVASAGGTMFSVGPGLRLAFSDKLDFGFGMQFAVTQPRLANQLYRSELRWRF